MISRTKELAAVAATALLIMAAVNPARATEGAAGVYLNGFTGFMAGVVPPPGTYVTNYVYHYSGDAGADLEIPTAGSVELGAKVDVLVDAVSLIHITDKKIFGANWGFGLLGAYGDVEVEVSASGSLGTVSRESEVSGLGDPVIIPYLLGWKQGNHNISTGLAVIVPAGKYKNSRLANVGLNHWALEPNVAYTYFNPKNGREFSFNLIYDYNFENPDTNYKSGQELHADYTIAQYFPIGLAIGFGGYLYQQITDDDGAPARLDGFRGRALAIGPQLLYNLKIDDTHQLTLQAKYHIEFETKNRLKGESFWFNMTFNF